MYLVSTDRFKQPSIFPISVAQPKAPLPKKKKRSKQKKREKIREADIKRKTQIQAIAEFLKNVLPDTAFSSRLKSSPPSAPKILRFSGTQTEEEAAGLPTPAIASTSKEVVDFTPTHRPYPEHEEFDDDYYDDDDDDNNFAEEDVQAFGRENVGTIASPYIVPYFYNKRFLDNQYGIRKVGDSFPLYL